VEFVVSSVGLMVSSRVAGCSTTLTYPSVASCEHCGRFRLLTVLDCGVHGDDVFIVQEFRVV
jgi:hypothetical protein